MPDPREPDISREDDPLTGLVDEVDWRTMAHRAAGLPSRGFRHRGLIIPRSFKAEMARRGLAPNQLTPWWSPDTASMVDPLDSPETKADVRHCLNDIWYAGGAP